VLRLFLPIVRYLWPENENLKHFLSASSLRNMPGLVFAQTLCDMAVQFASIL
jgi:hypothetical protein